MSSVSSSGPGRGHRRQATAIKNALRELTNQISLLNHQVGSRLSLRDGDLACLDLINREGPLSPSALARRTGLHPATMTGILDRLQRAGWIARDRDPEAVDRRAVTIRAATDRGAEIFGLYAGMNTSLDTICAGYTEEELVLLAGFLQRAIDAGRVATDQLTNRQEE